MAQTQNIYLRQTITITGRQQQTTSTIFCCFQSFETAERRRDGGKRSETNDQWEEEEETGPWYIYIQERIRPRWLGGGTIFIISERRSRGEWNKSETFPRRFKKLGRVTFCPCLTLIFFYTLSLFSDYIMYTSYAPVWHGLVYLYTKTLIICKWLPNEIKSTAWLGCSNGPLYVYFLVIILTMQPLVLCIYIFPILLSSWPVASSQWATVWLETKKKRGE